VSNFKRSLTINEQAFGREHPSTGQILSNLATAYIGLGQFKEAEEFGKRALPNLQVLGPEHRSVAAALENLAAIYFAQRDWTRAAEFQSRVTEISMSRSRREQATLSTRMNVESSTATYQFAVLIKILHQLEAQTQSAGSAYVARSFLLAQLAQLSSTSESVAHMAARQASGKDNLGPIIRERQDLVHEWQLHDKVLVSALLQPTDRRDAAREDAVRARLETIANRVAAIDSKLLVDFPEYSAFANPQLLSIIDVQRLLGANEALIAFLDMPEMRPVAEETFVWVVTKTDARLVYVEIGTKGLAERVIALRCGVDQTAWETTQTTDQCQRLLKGSSSNSQLSGREKGEASHLILPERTSSTGFFSDR
jgi:tetratricopeptide (TPR) repeat protein